MYTQIILYLTILATLIQIFYWLYFFARLAFFKNTAKENLNEPPVSVIICAKNEAENLKHFLPRILNQNYRSFEVIVVNDNSTDDSVKILTYLQKTFSHLRIIDFINNKKTQVGKKFALAEGIKNAKFETLLLTDADCYPASEDWLRIMQNAINEKVEIGLGYGPYEERKGLLNKFIRFETIYTATQYFSFALAGMPYMGVGRNLIYKKKLFKQANGFKNHEDVASGDDDLFINAVAKHNNVGILIQPSTFVYSSPKTTLKAFFRQKSRHLSTGRRYQKKHQLLLGLLSLSHFMHYLGIIAVAIKISIIFAILLYLVRIFIICSLYNRILKKLQDTPLLFWVPFLDAMYILYYVIFAPILFFGKTKRWN